jgi:hypothetical protein
MEENKINGVPDKHRLWLSHALVAVVALVVLFVLLVVQPWTSEVIAVVDSFRVSVSSSITEGNVSSEAAQEVAYITPDRGHVMTTSNNEVLEIIVIGEDLYSTDVNYVMAGYQSITITMSISGMIPSEEHTKTTLDQLTDIEELAIKRIDGVTCRHFRGRIDFTSNIQEQIDTLDPEQENYESMIEMLKAEIETLSEIRTNIEVWVGRDDGLIRMLKYEAEVPSQYSDTPSTTSTLLRYYDINKNVVIEPPLDSSGGLLPGWYQSTS